MADKNDPHAFVDCSKIWESSRENEGCLHQFFGAFMGPCAVNVKRENAQFFRRNPVANFRSEFAV